MKFHNQLAANYSKGNIIFSPGRDLLLIPTSNRVSCIDVKTYKQATLETPLKWDVKCQAITPDGKYLACMDEFNILYILSLQSRGRLICTYKITKKYGTASVTSLKFSNKGQLIVIQTNVALLYDIPFIRNPKNISPNTVQFIKLFNESRTAADFTSVDFSDDGSILALGNESGQIIVYSAVQLNGLKISRLCLNRLTGNDRGSIVFVKILKNGDVLSVSSNRNVRLYERSINLDEESDEDMEDDSIKNVEFVNLAKIGNPDAEERKLQAETKVPMAVNQLLSFDVKIKQLISSDNPVDVTCADYHEKGQVLAVGQKDGSFSMWDIPDLNMLHRNGVNKSRLEWSFFAPYVLNRVQNHLIAMYNFVER